MISLSSKFSGLQHQMSFSASTTIIKGRHCVIILQTNIPFTLVFSFITLLWFHSRHSVLLYYVLGLLCLGIVCFGFVEAVNTCCVREKLKSVMVEPVIQ